MKAMNKYIDHTLLKPDATKDMIEKLCEEAKQYDFASVCVNPYWVNTCYELLKETNIQVCTVIGFPLGATMSEVKAFEAKLAVSQGAKEIDMVMNIAELKAGNYEAVKKDIGSVVKQCEGMCVKVIIETCLLTKEEIVKACELCVEEHATFVKTSTGFSNGGATVEDVQLMKETVKGKCYVKASGGIRSSQDMKKMINAGADRIGTSSGIRLLCKE